MPAINPSPAVITALVNSSPSIQVIGVNLTRIGLYVFNPGTIVLWLCPAFGPQSALNPGGLAVAAAVAGAGSVALQPQQGLQFGFGALPPFTAALNAIAASASNNPLTIWEFYQ